MVAADAGLVGPSPPSTAIPAWRSGIEHGLVVVTKADLPLADVGAVAEAARAGRLAGTGLADAPVVTVSAATGEGLVELRAALDRVLAGTPPPEPDARVRFWIDRSFSVTGAGTVVTGTLAAGTLTRGLTLDLAGHGPASIRGLQQHGSETDRALPTTRVAVNLRGVGADQVARGDVLLTPDAWWTTSTLDVRRTSRTPFTDCPARLVAHVGTAAVPARLRPFDDDHGRITLDRPLPLALADRLVLRDPSTRRGWREHFVLDVDPPGAGPARGRPTPGGNPGGHAPKAATSARRSSAAARSGPTPWPGWASTPAEHPRPPARTTAGGSPTGRARPGQTGCGPRSRSCTRATRSPPASPSAPRWTPSTSPTRGCSRAWSMTPGARATGDTSAGPATPPKRPASRTSRHA